MQTKKQCTENQVKMHHGVVNTRDPSKENLYDLLENHIDYVEEVYFAGGEPSLWMNTITFWKG